MENPDDPGFQDFVLSAMDVSFSSAFNDDHMDSDEENILINNVRYSSESDSEDHAPSPRTITPDRDAVQPLPGPSHQTTQDNHETSPPNPFFAPLQDNDPLSTPAPQTIRPSTPTPVRPHTTAQQRRAPLSSTTVWRNVSDNDPGPPHTVPIYSANKGPILPSTFDADTEPIEYFELFFNDEIINHICSETNLFALKRQTNAHSPHARIKKWTDVTPVTMKAFIGTIINMGLIPLPSLDSYFTTAWDGKIPFFGDVFSKDEFLNIFWNIHFNHLPKENCKAPKGFHIAPILTHMKKMTKLFYTPGPNVSIDESTISFKGKVSFRVYNPMKPTKFGLKVFVLSDSDNGYLYDYIPYYGSGSIIPNTTLLKTTQIVKVLVESVVNKNPVLPSTGLHVYTDRYYTSPELADELLSIGCFLTGTVMTNRTQMPKGLKAKGKKMKKGEIYSQRKGPTLVLSWRDKRTVHMLSTFNKGSKSNTTIVPSRWPDKPPTVKPNVVIDYIKHMGGVDRSDHFISSYQFMRRTKKWYRKLFFWLLEVALIDAYLLYKTVQTTHNKKPLTHRMFRKSLVKMLVQKKVANRPKARKRGRPAQGPPEERLEGKPHFMERREKGARCVMCYKQGQRRETIYYCKTCTAHPTLHPDKCFEQYHTEA